MDDLLSKFNEVILQTFAAESRLEEEFKKCTLKLDEHISQSITNGTPVQNKKRPKRLGSLDELDQDQEAEADDDKSSSSSSVAPVVRSSQQKKNSVRDKPRSLETAPAVPELEESSSSRPARSARVKACKNLKEPTLNSKMRQNSGVVIKQERISMEARKERNPVEPMELDVENDGNVLNGVAPLGEQQQQRKSNDEGFGSTNEKEETPAAREMSIMVIPQPIPKVEVLSDDEAAEKMPPPSMPPPSKPVAKSKAKSKKVKSSDVFPVAIKREKDADDSSSSAVSSAESTLSNASSVRSSTSTRGRKKKDSAQAPQPQVVQIKKEKISTGKTKEKPPVASPTASEKSVYEDALEGGDVVMKPLVVSVGKMPLGETEKNRTFAMDKNGTFTAANGTFVVPSPTSAANGTFNVKSPEGNPANATFDVRQLPGPANSTFVMDNKKGTPEAAINASIMTEDNSYTEEMPEKAPVVVPAKKPAVAKKPQTTQSKTKKNNELFSLQSPIKSRIEAFEKAAVGSPMHTRTGTAASKHTTPSQTARLPSKTSTTPLASQRFPTSAKASQHTPTAQNILPGTAKGISASASKLAHLQKKPTITTGAITKSQSLSREPSMERQPGTLSAASSSSSLANMDEKKKKREEKQRLAQQQREQMEKEKREHAERLMREKDEKHRKLVQEKEEKLRADAVKKARKMEEFEKRRHLEELNQRMLAEQKREELAKLEQQQRAEQADLLKMNQAKENYEIKLHKQMYQQKMQQQQKLAQAQQQLQLKKLKPGAVDKQDKETFTFDMIETDDSTDDEGSNTAPNNKKKRPPLPAWCSKDERRQPSRIQAEIKLKVIDQFFSVAPMTPDLREIFPAIDARKLKRNSSAVWRTPPRYSQMPKY